MILTELQVQILERHYAGEAPVQIAKALLRNTREVRAIIDLHAKKPDVKYGFKALQQLAREAGLLK